MGNQVFSESAKQWKIMWVFALVWNALIGFAAMTGGEEFLKACEEQPIFYFFISFPFIGIWIVIAAAKETRAWYKFGKTPVILDPFPGQVGGRFGGHLDLPVSIDLAKQAIVTLTCIRLHYVGTSGSERSRQESPVWQDKVTYALQSFGVSSRLNFTFNPPKELPATEEPSEDYHFWRLHVRVPLPGIDFDRIFVVPLELANEPVLAQKYNDSTNSSSVADQPHAETGETPKITNTLSGTQFYYRYGRSKVFSIITLLFGISLGVFAYYFFDGFLTSLPTTMKLMSACVWLIALALVFLSIFIVGNNLTIEVTLKGICKQQKILGYMLEEIIDAHNIVDIIVKQNGSSSSGNNTRVWYKLNVLTADGQEIEVGDSLEGQRYANQISQQMISCLGGSWQPAIAQTLNNKIKKPLPKGFQLTRKIFSFSLIIALAYDLSRHFPQIKIFFSDILSFI